jgi:hypothetical protein
MPRPALYHPHAKKIQKHLDKAAKYIEKVKLHIEKAYQAATFKPAKKSAKSKKAQ